MTSPSGHPVVCTHCKRVLIVLPVRDDRRASEIASQHRVLDCDAQVSLRVTGSITLEA